ncbi:MAG: type I-E CRISPR-associated endoribonuclease Cas2e [Acidobacteriaceae bacterium]
MANLCVFVVHGAKSSLRGAMQRVMLEIAPGVFTGRLSAKVIRAIWAEIIEQSTSAVAIVSARNEMGIAALTHGQAKRIVVDNYGIPLVSYRKESAAKKDKKVR